MAWVVKRAKLNLEKKVFWDALLLKLLYEAPLSNDFVPHFVLTDNPVPLLRIVLSGLAQCSH